MIDIFSFLGKVFILGTIIKSKIILRLRPNFNIQFIHLLANDFSMDNDDLRIIKFSQYIIRGWKQLCFYLAPPNNARVEAVVLLPCVPNNARVEAVMLFPCAPL